MNESAAVAIVNYNTREHLRRCVQSALSEQPAQTIVVDNGSDDGSVTMMREEFPSVELVVEENRGYGAAGNVAVRRARTRYVLLLNSDVRLYKGALATLVEYLSAGIGVGIAGPCVIDEQGRIEKSARAFPTPGEILLQETGLHRLPIRRLQQLPPDHGGSVEWLLGAAMAIDVRAFERVGGFDDAYFMYGEEIDLCLRLRQAGWAVHYVPTAQVTHVGGASTSQRRAAMTGEYVRSLLLLYNRHGLRRKTKQLRVLLALVFLARIGRDATRRALRRRRDSELDERVAAWRAGLAVLRAVR
jgi:N-acetylglucosaminyl-diphospho-decaprenol L-rhamnosyltransferase